MKKTTFQDLQRAYQLRSEPEHYLYVAHFSWILMCVVATLVMVLSIIFGAWKFIEPPQEASIDIAAAGISGFNRAQLKAVVEAFEKRATAFDGMMSGE